MSMTRDDGHQALDFNIGRILQMFLIGDLSFDATKAELAKYYHPSAEFDTALGRTLDNLKGGGLSASQARADLVKAAAAAERNDPDFVRFLKQDAG